MRQDAFEAVLFSDIVCLEVLMYFKSRDLSSGHEGTMTP